MDGDCACALRQQGTRLRNAANARGSIAQLRNAAAP
jgi:hypothetical protein